MKINVQVPPGPGKPVPTQLQPVRPAASFAAQPVQAVNSARNTPPAAGFSNDTVHISLGNRVNGRPATAFKFSDAPDAGQKEFGSAVHVETPRDPDAQRLFGLLNLTANQRQQIRAAESRAFDRFFHAGNSPERGSIQAKLRQAAIETHQPGFLEHNSAMSITDQEKDQIMDALKQYGEELAAIGISGRNKRELQRYVEDKFYITIFDRDRDEFQDYFKGGVKDFFGDYFGNNTPDNNLVNPAKAPTSAGVVELKGEKEQQEEYKWRFFQPRMSVSLKGVDFKEATIKPKVDLVKLRGPADTEVRVVADVPFNFNGKYEPRGEIYARRIMNHKPGEYGGWKDNVWAESRTEYDFSEQQVRTSLGVRKQISPDASMGFYGMYSKNFSGGNAPEDLGLGVNYQSRFN